MSEPATSGGPRRPNWPASLVDVTRRLHSAPADTQLLNLRIEAPVDGSYTSLPGELDPRLVDALGRKGITQLYSHQAATYDAAAGGSDVVVTTPTASGKTLCFNLPILSSILREPDTRALYLYPTKALANDQLASLGELVRPLDGVVSVAVFTGDTPKEDRAAVMASPPNILIANPDILHDQQLADHMAWERWWSHLRWVVIDEAHTYRGIFGAHVAHVLRRLIRVAAHYDARPQFIAASATIANPVELVSSLTGRQPLLVGESGSPRPGRDIAIWQPRLQRMTPTGPIYEAVEPTTAEFVVASLLAGKSCIAFARSRRVVERIRRDVDRELAKRGRRDLVGAVRSYRAGYEPDVRREIERGLRTGAIRAVISTVALELGIDIGSLDVAILAGYPGSAMSFWQQAGRAGRRGSALVLLIASQNPLDQYMATHAERLVGGPVEDAVIDPANDEVASRQLTCAARELTLRDSEASLFGDETLGRVATAVKQGWVVRERRGWMASPGHGRPDSVSLRGIQDTRYTLLVGESPIGEIESRYLPREAHEGAIYLHDGEPYRVVSVDDDLRLVRVRPSDEGVLTDPIGERSILERSHRSTRMIGPLRVELLDLGIVDKVIGYVELGEGTRRQRGSPFTLPRPRELRIETVGIRLALEEASGSAMHAAEHLGRSLGSVTVLCDPADLEGHTEVDGIVKAYIYDRTAGGVGLAKALFGRVDEVLSAARSRVDECVCEDGCPACIQSGSCIRRNRALDKVGARRLLEKIELRSVRP